MTRWFEPIVLGISCTALAIALAGRIGGPEASDPLTIETLGAVAGRPVMSGYSMGHKARLSDYALTLGRTWTLAETGLTGETARGAFSLAADSGMLRSDSGSSVTWDRTTLRLTSREGKGWSVGRGLWARRAGAQGDRVALPLRGSGGTLLLAAPGVLAGQDGAWTLLNLSAGGILMKDRRVEALRRR